MTPTTSPTTKTTKTTMTIKEFLGSLEYFRLLTLVVLLVFVSPVLSGYSWGQLSRDPRNQDEVKEAPEFQVATSSITALVGQPVYLPCRVRNLGDRVVSWIRTRDLHILTSGTLTYTSDSRFEVLHNPGSEMWTLRIMSVQPRDQGKYECQVNTDPKINFAIQLTIRETDMQDEPSMAVPHDGPMAAAIIEGPKEQYVSRASTVTFTCVVMSPYTHPNKAPRSVDWFHSDRLVTIQAQRGGISIVTDKTDLHTKSRLTVAGVSYRDAGNYTCRPTDTQPASVQLIVLEGEHTEAMQRDGNPSKGTRSSLLSLTYQLVLLVGLNVFHLAGIT